MRGKGTAASLNALTGTRLPWMLDMEADADGVPAIWTCDAPETLRTASAKASGIKPAAAGASLPLARRAATSTTHAPSPPAPGTVDVTAARDESTKTTPTSQTVAAAVVSKGGKVPVKLSEPVASSYGLPLAGGSEPVDQSSAASLMAQPPLPYADFRIGQAVLLHNNRASDMKGMVPSIIVPQHGTGHWLFFMPGQSCVERTAHGPRARSAYKH